MLALLTLLAVAPALAAPEPMAVPEITLLDPGAEPRQLLRLTPAVGQVENVVYRSQVSTDVDVKLFPADVSTTREVGYTLRLEVREAAPEIAYRFTIAELERTRVERKRSVELASDALLGLTGTMRITDRGLPVSVGFAVPDGLSDEDLETHGDLRDAARRLVTPLPEEPVGVGARWEARSRSVFGILHLSLVARFELISLEGGVATIEETLGAEREGSTVVMDPADRKAKGELTALDVAGFASFRQPLHGVSQTARDAWSTFAVGLRFKKGPLPIRAEVEVAAKATRDVVP